MKRAFSILIAATCFVAEPLLAMEAQSAAPQELSTLGLTSEDLNDVGPAVADEATPAEVEMMRQRGRSCPWGQHLISERVRVGRLIVTRYRCERDHGGRGGGRDHGGRDHGGGRHDGRGGHGGRGHWDIQQDQSPE